jgi:hypothetical protein
MKKSLTCLALLIASVAAQAENTPLICIWEAGPGKKQSYIIEFDAQQNTVAFNGAPASEVEISADSVKFTLHFKEVFWTHVIGRKDGLMKVTKSNATDTLQMQCGKLQYGNF